MRFITIVLLVAATATPAGAGPEPGNVVLTQLFGSQVSEYTPSGVFVRNYVVPHPGGGSDTRGVAVDGAGRLHVYNDPFSTYLSTYDPSAGTWSHHTHPGWSSYNCFPCNGLDTHLMFVFATDENVDGRGIIRFTLPLFEAVRFGSGTDYSDLSVGLDGLVYARRADPFEPPPLPVIDVFDPHSGQILHSVTLSEYTLTVAAAGVDRLFGVRFSDIVEFGMDGSIRARHPVPVNGALYDIDIAESGRFVVTSGDGEVVVLEPSFAVVGAWRPTFSSTYASLVDGRPTTASRPTWGRVKTRYR